MDRAPTASMKHTDNNKSGLSDSARGESQSSSDAPPRIRSEVLLGKRTVLIIEHGGREYRLRQTSTGKLILTA